MTDRRAAERRGRRAEALAAWWLRLKGWRVLGGYALGRGSGAGQVDLVARRGGVLAFVEVKARADAVRAAEALSSAQRRRLERGAEAFLNAHPELAGLSVRFDAVLVVPWRLPRHLQDAWRPESARIK